MENMAEAFRQFERRLAAWAHDRADVRAVLILGSRARTDRSADQWSDLDISLVVTDPQPYIDTTGWLDELGRVVLTFTELSAGGSPERRALFEGMVDVDFVPLSTEVVQARLDGSVSAESSATLARGVRVLVDKDGLAARITHMKWKAPVVRPPTEDEYLNVVNDFWYHVVWTAKKIGRGELWTALLKNSGEA